MKWLSSGLTFVNAATVFGLLLGLAAGGLSWSMALAAVLLALLVAFFAWSATDQPARRRAPRPPVSEEAPVKLSKRAQRRLARAGKIVATAPPSPPPPNYRVIWLWLIGICFAMFAVRSFCWLLFIDGDHLKIQSPNNLGDLALHITYIREFANGVSIWPDNPIYPFGTIRYPAGIDLFNALLFKLGLDLRHGFIWVGLLGSIATFYAFWRWGGVFAIAGFLFNGGLAGFAILNTGKWKDYEGLPTIAWKSIPLAMFVTQRGLLYAIPAGVLLLCQWQRKFFPADDEETASARRPPLPFWVECSLYATMPLFHVHTFLALSVALAFWFLIGTWIVRKQLLQLVGIAFLPATFLVWIVSDHFAASSLLGWQPGWVQKVGEFARPFFSFWFVNFGLWLPLTLILLGLCFWQAWRRASSLKRLPDNIAFLAPAAVIFIFACLVRTAQWEWDNTKIFIWAYFMVLPFLWRDLIARWPIAPRAATCFLLFASGFVSLLGGLNTSQPAYDFAMRSEVDGVALGLRNIPAEARFAAFPTFNHPLLLNGRKMVLGYSGHLWSQGFDYRPIEDQLNSLMNGAPDWQEIAVELRAGYLFWGRDEKANYPNSKKPWEKSAPKIASGPWGAIYDLEPDRRQ
jgi:hypothetical protein